MKKIWKKFLIWFGVVSACCNARVDYNEPWDRTYCSKCGKRIS